MVVKKRMSETGQTGVNFKNEQHASSAKRRESKLALVK